MANSDRLPTVKTPEGFPTFTLTTPAVPKKRGKSPEQYAKELAAYRATMREHIAAIAAFRRERAVEAGIIHYRWVSADITGECKSAEKNDGKVFSYSETPEGGHVGEGYCTATDWCRCFAKPVVPGFS